MLEAFKNLFRRKSSEKLIYSSKEGDDTISVVENDEERSVKLNNITYSRLNKKSIYTNSYWDYFIPLPALYKKPKILMIGLGGGTIAFQLKKIFGEKVSIDIIELSKKMVEASKYFLPKKLTGVKIIIEDGASYIKTKTDYYDIIILDAYEGDHIPSVFLANEFAADVNKALKNNGVFAVNYALSLSALVYLEHYLKDLRKLFNVYTINNPFTSGNMLILGSKSFNRDEILKKIKEDFKENDENKTVLMGYREMT